VKASLPWLIITKGRRTGAASGGRNRVARNGTVKQLDVVKGDAVLARAAADGVRKWKFRPTVVDGKTVEVESEIQVQFTLLP